MNTFKIPQSWLNDHPRDELEKHLLAKIVEVNMNCVDLNNVRLDEKEIAYNTAKNNAYVTVIYVLLHLLVNPTHYPKPWLVRTRIKAPLEIINFKEYIADVRNWLASQAPTTFYGSLVYIQSLTLLLSTMEITND